MMQSKTIELSINSLVFAVILLDQLSPPSHAHVFASSRPSALSWLKKVSV